MAQRFVDKERLFLLLSKVLNYQFLTLLVYKLLKLSVCYAHKKRTHTHAYRERLTFLSEKIEAQKRKKHKQ